MLDVIKPKLSGTEAGERRKGRCERARISHLQGNTVFTAWEGPLLVVNGRYVSR